MSGIQKLIEGYHDFYAVYFGKSPKAQTFKRLVTKGQRPEIMLICCSDSRIDPSVLFNCEPGDLFVVRNVANLVPPYDPNPRHHSTSSALEFAVKHLGVKDIIILGHSQCGGIQTLLETPNFSDASQNDKSFIFHWMQIAKEAKKTVLSNAKDPSDPALVCTCAKEALHISIKNLHSFPWIEERALDGSLRLHAWYFDLATGTLDRQPLP